MKLKKLLIFFTMVLSFSVFSQPGENDLTQKVMMGYQGWFLTQGDGSPVNDWRHWFKSSDDPSIEQINIDNWPDLSEYTQTYPTKIEYNDGSNVELYSAYNESTTNLHFQWMKDYNIYGIYLQRFLGEAVGDQRFFQVRNHVLENVIHAAKVYDRHFALMYDVTGVPEDGFYDKLVNDWEYLVDTYDMLNAQGYVKQNGKPVVAIWGMGFTHNDVTAETAMRVLDYFHKDADEKYRAYVMGGVPGRWRTLDGDSWSEPLWAEVYRTMDMLSPWTVGRYNKSSVDNWKTERIVPDLKECNDNGVDYMPVIFPGGSWFNLSGKIDSSRINDNPRDGGHFYWRQAYNAISAGVQFIYVAMFDEVDEGTAMYKLAESDADVPTKGTFVPLDADGYDLPSDWYLQVADYSQRMLDQTIPLTSELPITPQKIPVTNVTVSPKTAILAVGSSVQLVSSIEPTKAFNKNVIWTSSDESVVAVSSRGKVIAEGLGTATITVTTEDGAFTAECLVSVLDGKPVAGISITPNDVTADVGETIQLTATIDPADALNQTVRWTSSDMTIASVDSIGLVTALAEGDVTITVITQDGAKRATAKVSIFDSSQKPYAGAPHVIPGIIQAEDYDLGGEGVAYHDADATNNGNQYRRNEGVDIETCSEGGYSLGWFNAGEWLEYTIDVAEGGRYNIDIRCATEQNGGKFHIEFDGRNRTGILDVPNTGGWQSWQTLRRENVNLSPGVQVMRVYREVDGADFNVNYFSIEKRETGVDNMASTITRADLYPAFPNPFNANTTIKFDIAKSAYTQLIIYDMLGRKVKTLVDQKLEPGRHSVVWDSTNNDGLVVASGIYVLRMQTDSDVKINKLILLR